MDRKLSSSSPEFIPIDMDTSSETSRSSTTYNSSSGSSSDARSVLQPNANTNPSPIMFSTMTNNHQYNKKKDLKKQKNSIHWSIEDNHQVGRFMVRTFNNNNIVENEDQPSSSIYTNGDFDTISSLIQRTPEENYEDDSDEINDDEDMSGEAQDLNDNSIVPHVEVLISRLRNDVVRPKNFSNEVRAGRDIKFFLNNPCVLLDLNGDSVEEIIDQMLTAINKDLDGTLLSEARCSLYDAKNAFQLTDFLQGIYHTENGEYLHDPTWLCTFATVNNLPARRIVLARLERPSNFGPTLRQVQLIVLVLVPYKEKTSKSAFEIARTFASLLTDSSLRMALLTSDSEAEFCSCIAERAAYLKRRHSCRGKFKTFSLDKLEHDSPSVPRSSFKIGHGLVEDFKRRIKFYPSDFIDGIVGKNTIPKVSAAVLSIFFACILPPIAFGVVNEHNTKGLIGPKEGLVGQAFGGLVFALISGQPLVIIATTAPLTLYVSIVYQASVDWNVDFLDLFAAVGCFCAFYLISYAMFNISNLMKYVTRSTEEIFASFVCVAFTAAAINECYESFQKHYCFDNLKISTTTNITEISQLVNETRDCLPAKSILFLFLMLGTVAMAVLLYNFSFTPFLSSFFRGMLADYALPLSVITFSLIGSALFHDVHADSFVVNSDFQWRFATFKTLTPPTIALAAILGFFLSMLFFIAQSVCASIVASPSNHLKKGSAFHWDLFVLGLLNALLSLMGLPWIYGVLPHSPLHAHLLADVVPATDSQHNSSKSYVVVRIRETRVTGVLVHLMIGLVAILIPDSLTKIPVAVLCGLFLYCAISTLRNNSIFDRVVLFLTEQHSYPPTSYLRHVPQRIVHCFTAAQLALLALISFVGFCPWKKFRLFFPFMIALMIPIRRFILPIIFDHKHLEIIDSKHY